MFGATNRSQATTQTFGSPGFGQSTFGGQQRGGSRITPYTVTIEEDSSGTQPDRKLESISAMPTYISKSHEELRWEDFQLGDKGVPYPTGQSAGANPFAASSSTPTPFGKQSSPFSSTAPSNPFSSSPASNLFSSTTSNPFAPKPFSTGFGSASNLFSSTTYNPFAPKPFSMGFGSASNLFSSTTSNPFAPKPFSTGFGSGSGTSLFGSTSLSATSVSGQTNNASNNLFASKPFGSTAPFGSPQTGSSIFGGTSTGVFGATQSSAPHLAHYHHQLLDHLLPLRSEVHHLLLEDLLCLVKNLLLEALGLLLHKQVHLEAQVSHHNQLLGPVCLELLHHLVHRVLLHLVPPQLQPLVHPTPAFGATSTLAFVGTGNPAFGATTPFFGSTPTSVFASTGSAFGASSSSVFGTGGAFGASSTPAFGSSSTPAFGASSSPAFGASSSPAFGISTPGFGTSSSPSFSFGSSPTFGQSPSAFGSSPFASSSPFEAQIVSQATTQTFGSPGFGQSTFGGQQHGGSRVTPYAVTIEEDSGGTQPDGKLESISAMPAYISKSHEELRWEDYQLGDKGVPNLTGQSAGANPFAASSSTPTPFGGQSSPFSSTAPSNPFSSTTPSNQFSSSPASNLFSSATSNPFAPKPFSTGFGSVSGTSLFGSTSLSATSVFGTPTTSAFGASTSSSLFPTVGPSTFGTSPSIFSSTPGATGISSGFTSQSSPLFSSITPSFSQTSSSFGQATTAFGQTAAPFGQSSTPILFQTNIFATPSTGFSVGSFSSSPSWLTSTSAGGFSLTISSFSLPFQPSQPQTGSPFGFSNLSQPQPAVAGAHNIFGQSNFVQSSTNLSSAPVQAPPPSSNSFGTVPAMPQMSIGRAGTGPSIQYGISSTPVVDKPAPVRVSPLLTSQHLSQMRMRLPARKYHPKDDRPKVPFFSDQEETTSTRKADALIIPRENPRALVIRPEYWAPRASAEKSSPVNDTLTIHENGKENGVSLATGPSTMDKGQTSAEDGHLGELPSRARAAQKSNGVHEDHAQKSDSYKTQTGQRAGEAAIVYEHGADIEALMPKLRHTDYYTEPTIQELAAKERAEPGFCCYVKDFVVGRHGFGSIRFMGETDVRRLDLESLVQFNNREVIVYMDDSKKPPVGQGLNKPAEVTLLNMKCFDKMTGKQYTEGPMIAKYMEVLKMKARDQGADFVSYDPMEGEWKFRVGHFSRYELRDDDEAWEPCDDAIDL